MKEYFLEIDVTKLPWNYPKFQKFVETCDETGALAWYECEKTSKSRQRIVTTSHTTPQGRAVTKNIISIYLKAMGLLDKVDVREYRK